MHKKILIVLVTFISIGILVGFYTENDLAIKEDTKNLIRFHVLANSDSPEDQALKLKVRDRIMVDMSEVLAEVTSIEDSRRIILKNMDRIQETAIEELIKNGSEYDVKVVLSDHIFPTRRYGDMIFAAGKYEALRIIIGDGEGQNWWCVMFPPLCFIDVKNGLIDEKTKQELKTALTEEEYQLVAAQFNEKEMPIQLRSKVFDFFKSSKNQISRLAINF